MIVEVKNNYPTDMLRIEYMLGNLCNHKCSYCFPGSNEGTYPWPEIETVKKNLGHLLDHYKRNGKTLFQFYLIGGEPTLWKDLPELCKFLKDNYNSIINISTNGSRKLDWWKDNCKLFDNIEISVHHEFANIDHLKLVADLTYSSKIHVVSNVLMDPDHFDKCRAIIEDMKTSKKRWGIIAKSVHFNGQTRYTDEQRDYVKNSVKRIPNIIWYLRTIKNPVIRNKVSFTDNTGKNFKVPSDSWFALYGLNKFKGWECNLGVDHIEIFQDGNISGNCRQKIFGLSGYYNLYDKNFVDEFNPTISPTICQQNICGCSSEIIIRKHVKV
jgi:organic radical activating enzyme